MPCRPVVPLLALLVLAACGGSDTATATNPYLGTLNITSAAATNACVRVLPVSFTAGAVTPRTVNAAVGDCVSFTNDDQVGSHQVASIGTPDCPLLNGPIMAPGALPFQTLPLPLATTCHWQDLQNPPPAGGGGGGY